MSTISTSRQAVIAFMHSSTQFAPADRTPKRSPPPAAVADQPLPPRAAYTAVTPTFTILPSAALATVTAGALGQLRDTLAGQAGTVRAQVSDLRAQLAGATDPQQKQALQQQLESALGQLNNLDAGVVNMDTLAVNQASSNDPNVADRAPNGGVLTKAQIDAEIGDLGKSLSANQRVASSLATQLQDLRTQIQLTSDPVQKLALQKQEGGVLNALATANQKVASIGETINKLQLVEKLGASSN
jgi:hypothetical protein